MKAYKVKSEIFKDVLRAYARIVDDATTEGNNIGNAIKDHIIDLLARRKNHDLSKKFKLDFYYAYKYLSTSFFANLNAEDNWTTVIREKYQEIEVVKKVDKTDAHRRKVFVENDNKAYVKVEEINEPYLVKQGQAPATEVGESYDDKSYGRTPKLCKLRQAPATDESYGDESYGRTPKLSKLRQSPVTEIERGKTPKLSKLRQAPAASSKVSRRHCDPFTVLLNFWKYWGMHLDKDE